MSAVGTVENNKAIVSRWIVEVFNKKKLESIEHLKFLSYLDWTPFPSQQMDLPVSGLKKSLPEFFTAFPDFNFKPEELMAEGDMVVCLGTWRATHKGELMGIPPTGREVSGTRMDIFRISGDKMSEHWGCGGELATLQLLGAVPFEEFDSEAAFDNKAIARRYIEEVINRRNLAVIEQLVDAHAVDHSNQALNMFLLLNAFPDYQLTIDRIVAEDDTVTVLSTFKATHQGVWMNKQPTGQPVTARRTDTLRIANGKIVESWQEWDSSLV